MRIQKNKTKTGSRVLENISLEQGTGADAVLKNKTEEPKIGLEILGKIMGKMIQEGTLSGKECLCLYVT